MGEGKTHSGPKDCGTSSEQKHLQAAPETSIRLPALRMPAAVKPYELHRQRQDHPPSDGEMEDDFPPLSPFHESEDEEGETSCSWGGFGHSPAHRRGSIQMERVSPRSKHSPRDEPNMRRGSPSHRNISGREGLARGIGNKKEGRAPMFSPDESSLTDRSDPSVATTLPSLQSSRSQSSVSFDRRAKPAWRPSGSENALKFLRDRRGPTWSTLQDQTNKQPVELDLGHLQGRLEQLFHDEEAFVKLAQGEQASIGLDEWQSLLVSVGIIPQGMSKSASIRIFGRAEGSGHGRMMRKHFQEGLRLVASKLGMTVAKMPMPGNWRLGGAQKEIKLSLPSILASDQEGAVLDTVEKLMVTKKKREHLRGTITQDTEKQGVGGFKLDYLRTGEEKLKRVCEAHEQHNMLVAVNIDDLKKRMRSVGIKPSRTMRF